MIRTYEDAINVLAERTYENRQQLKRQKEQRRVSFVDLYGVPYVAQGDALNPATFYISISPDLIYYERFAFKFVIESFESSVSGVSGTALSINNTSLEIENDAINPNPHKHTITGGINAVSYGVKKQNTSSDTWAVHIGGVDITDYLMEQHDGDWIEGQGVFPSNGTEDYYDLLDVACMMEAEGVSTDPILKPEFKPVQIYSDAPFRVTAYLYCKYSHNNR